MKEFHKIEVDRVTAISMTYEILRNMAITFRKRKEGKISVEELVEDIEQHVQDCSIYDLPVMTEQLDCYQDNKLCRLIYQYMVVRSFNSHTQMGVSIKVLAEICGASYLETYAAVHRIELYGAIEQEYVINGERKKVGTDRYRLSQDLSFLWESFMPWDEFWDKEKRDDARRMEFMIYQSWRRKNVQPS